MLVRNGTVDFNRRKGSGPRSDRAEVIFPNAVTREPSPARTSWRIAVRRSASARLGACGGSQGERYRRRGTRARPWADHRNIIEPELALSAERLPRTLPRSDVENR